MKPSTKRYTDSFMFVHELFLRAWPTYIAEARQQKKMLINIFKRPKH